MSMVMGSSKKHLDLQYKTILELREMCKNPRLKKLRQVYEMTYYLSPECESSDGPAMIAVAYLGRKRYAIHVPSYIKGDQWKIIELFLEKTVDGVTYIVFSDEVFKKTQDALPKNVRVKVVKID